MSDIVVTTPKSEMKNAAEEAQQAIEAGGDTCYFRALASAPKGLVLGVSRIFYVEDGYVRGFGILDVAHNDNYNFCETTGRHWFGRCTLVMRASTWQWVKSIPMKGFQGWRYFDQPFRVIGGWRDPKPNVHT